MDEMKKREIFGDYKLRDGFINLLGGEFDDLFQRHDMDAIAGIIHEYNKKIGEYDIEGARNLLEDERVKKFSCEISPLSILQVLKTYKACIKILEHKDTVLEFASETVPIFDREEPIICTYGEILKKAEKFVHGEIYRIIYFYFEYKQFADEISDKRYRLRPSSKQKEVMDILNDESLKDEIGCIEIAKSDEEKRKTVLGTEREIALSELIGRPFDKDYSEYDRDGDHIYRKKYFYPMNPIKRMAVSSIRRASSYLFSDYSYDQLGYIEGNSGDHYFIYLSDLLVHHIDPIRIGWKPVDKLKINNNKLTLFDLKMTEKIDEEDFKLLTHLNNGVDLILIAAPSKSYLLGNISSKEENKKLIKK